MASATIRETLLQTTNPLTISPVALWLDAADLTTLSFSDGSNISQWRDKSGNGYHASPSGSAPTYSSALTSVVLNGTTQSFALNLDFLAGQDHQSFIVLRNYNFTNIYGALGGGVSANSLHIGFQNSTTYRMNFWGNDYAPVISAAYRSNARNIVSFDWQSTTSTKTARANGTLEGSTNQYGLIGVMNGGGRIGNVVGQGFLQADLCEIVFLLNANITLLNRQRMEGYLAHKWGLVENLPANHPFKVVNPSATFPPAFLPNSRNQLTNRPSFLPTQIPGCAVWLDSLSVNGQTISADNSRVASWTNLVTGGSNFTQASPSRQPTFLQNGLSAGYPSVYFNSSNTAASIQFLFAGPNVQPTRDASFFYVSRYTDVGSGDQTQIDQRKDVQGTALRTFKAAQYQLRDPAGNLYTLNYTSNTSPSIKSYRDTLNTSLGYFNGTLVTSSSGTYNQRVADNYGILIGSHFGADTNDGIAPFLFSKVFISEVLVYNRFLSLAEQQQIEGYLAHKWGLVANLPPTHPNRRSNPIILPAVALRSLPQFRAAFFNPRSITGCSLWFDADETTLTGRANVTQWRDKASGLILSGTGASFSRVNGIPAITFNANQYVTTTNLPYASLCTSDANFTCFLVQATASNSGANGLPFSIFLPQNERRFAVFANGSLGGGGIFVDAASQANPRLSFSQSQPFGSPQLLTITRRNITRVTNRFNGLQSATQVFTNPVNFLNRTNYLVYISEGSGPWRGNIYEILHFNRDLPDSEIFQVEGYLANKWGLGANLPSNHPFKRFPPAP